jgi:NhaA family Na+:H+ antiporter
MAKTETSTLKLPVGDRDHIRGAADAAVTLVEYGDYECSYCRQVAPVIKELRERFGDRLRYIFRHFPIKTAHPHAQMAAEAAEAAAAQGKFWEMHDLLFSYEGTLDRRQLVQFARELELDVARFERELDEHAYAERVRQDFRSGVRSGANGTPAFFLNDVRYDGPWDLDSLIAEVRKPLGVQVRLLFRQFTRLQASGGILLLAAAAVALIWANSPWGQAYFDLWETYLTISLGGLALKENLLHWVNDGLMVIFFFVVGLEIKREVLVGELATPRRAALPLVAAVGGMALPALIYVAFNLGRRGEAGWGIPMATDIAFVLGILTLFGSRVPISLKVFFTALAIADDLGAVLVLALFYSGEISWLALGVGAAFLVVLIVLNLGRVRHPLPYALLGIGLWLAFLQSGVHPTIAGVLLALTIPARSQVEAEAFMAQCTAALRGLGPGDPDEARRRRQAAAQTLEVIAERIQTPLQRLERNLNPWVAYLVVPVFALANAGVSLSGNLVEALTQPVSLGIILGLLVGKSLGITLFSWLAVKIGIADLPYGVSWRQLFAASWLAAIGFTMSLFIASSAFQDPALLALAKADILFASVLAAAIGFLLITVTSPGQGGHSMLDEEPASAGQRNVA